MQKAERIIRSLLFYPKGIKDKAVIRNNTDM